ncbi:MAG: NADH-quinone oxidoreductase subunit A [Candidatus Hydrogenedentes bacterium]|nr:NADH-quinone oxidoreductase subunit A [Candidatus Hydrogenedentota bacterium]
MDYFFVLMLAGMSAAMVAGGLAFSFLIAPHRPGAIKNSPYECGEPPIGQAWVQFNVGYYLFGLLFLVFDVEAAFLYPWAVAFHGLGFMAFLEMGIFLLVLILGLAYAWKKGALEWV